MPAYLIACVDISNPDQYAEYIAVSPAVVEQYGRSTRSKYRAVIYYLLVKHFKKSKVYA